MAATYTVTLCHIELLVTIAGPPDGDIVHGTDEFLGQSAAFALGFFLFEIRDSMNM